CVDLFIDPKAMASEHKFNRHGDFKKLANAALAPNASPDDLQKSKAGLRESITKGRSLVRACWLSTSVFHIFQQNKDHAQMVYLVSLGWAPLMLSTLISRKLKKEG
ncbi:hypothetical protein Tco_0314325, partial [Tanacetum coccineum]